jgi:hypothetical protein
MLASARALGALFTLPLLLIYTDAKGLPRQEELIICFYIACFLLIVSFYSATRMNPYPLVKELEDKELDE